MNILTNLGKLATLEPLKGKRSQITIAIGFILNLLVTTGVLKWTQDELNQVNTTLIFIFGYFFAEKVSK